jgi:uncharacterized membrane protein
MLLGVSSRPISRARRALGALMLALSYPAAGAMAGYQFRTVNDPSAAGNSEVTGITNSGQIVGYSLGSDNAYHGFVATPSGGTFHFVSYNAPNVSDTFINGINSSGQLVGSVDVNGLFSGFLGSTSNSKVMPLAVPGSTNTFAYGINDSGQAVGTYSVISTTNSYVAGFMTSDRGTTFTRLEDPEADNFTEARGINENGTIVGDYRDSSFVIHGFLATPGHGGTYSYTTLDDPSAVGATVILGINSLNQVVGYYDGSGNETHGFVATHVGSTYTFTNLDDPRGVRGTYGSGIDDSGTVVGFYFDTHTVSHGFIASAIPEPSSLVLMAIGALGLCGRRLLTRRACRVGRRVGDPPSHRRGLSPRSIGVASRQ